MSYDPYKTKVQEPINVQPVDATIYTGAPTYANPVGNNIYIILLYHLIYVITILILIFVLYIM